MALAICRLIGRGREAIPALSALATSPIAVMPQTHLSIRLDLTNDDRIGPGKIALLEAIRDTGSISAGARKIGMSYRRAWLLVEQINMALAQPAVEAAPGGRQGGGATVTDIGERLIGIYHAIEDLAYASARDQFKAIEQLARKPRRAKA